MTFSTTFARYYKLGAHVSCWRLCSTFVNRILPPVWQQGVKVHTTKLAITPSCDRPPIGCLSPQGRSRSSCMGNSQYINLGTSESKSTESCLFFQVDISDDVRSGRRENHSRRLRRSRVNPFTIYNQIIDHRSGVKSAWHGPLSMVRTTVVCNHIFIYC